MAGDERIRLFVALELPDDVRSALCDWLRRLALAAMRQVPEQSLHVTLCFLGSTEPDQVDPIAAAITDAAGGAASAPFGLGGPVWLPPRRPRVLAARVLDLAGRLEPVQSAVAGALQAGGWYEPEQRPFLAHVTVARVRRGESVRAAELPPPPRLTSVGTRVTLFRSHPGSRYEPLATARLRP